MSKVEIGYNINLQTDFACMESEALSDTFEVTRKTLSTDKDYTMLTQSELKRMFNYDPETGIVTRAIPMGMGNRFKVGSKVGTYCNGYLTVRINNKNTRLHRLIWKLVYNDEPEQIDHINGIRDDNRLCNLRAVTNSVNSKNVKLKANNKTGHFGVSYESNAWRARITVDGKKIHLGRFKTKEEAVNARKKAESIYGFNANHGRTT